MPSGAKHTIRPGLIRVVLVLGMSSGISGGLLFRLSDGKTFLVVACFSLPYPDLNYCLSLELYEFNNPTSNV